MRWKEFACVFACFSPVGIFATTPNVKIDKLGDVFEFKVDGQLVTKYHTRNSGTKPFFWPLNAPGNVPVTRDWPIRIDAVDKSRDHVHHKSAWIGHGDVIPDGVEIVNKVNGVNGIDFWSESLGHGVVEVRRIDSPEYKSDAGILRTLNVWKTPEGKVILDESRVITLQALEFGYLLTIRSVFKASNSGVTFGDTKEGTFAVRITDKISLSKTSSAVIRNSADGVGESACWGKRADWCDFSGVVDAKPYGVAMFDDPSNRSRACWHVRSYGLLAANPFGRARSGFPSQKGSPEQPIKLKAGEELKLRYGIYVHAGDVSEAKVKEVYRRFTAQRLE